LWGNRRDGREGVLLEVEKLSETELAEGEHGMELRFIEGRFFAAALEFDESLVIGHDKVHIDLGVDVFGVAEIEEGRVLDQSDTDGGDGVEEGGFGDFLRLEEALDGEGEGDKAAGDGGGSGAAVGLEDVAIDPDGARAEFDEVEGGAERSADESLDFLGTAVDAAAGAVARFTLERGVREHAVFCGDPAAEDVLFFHPAWDGFLDGDAADDASIAPFDEG
jgi:hypothetical protein